MKIVRSGLIAIFVVILLPIGAGTARASCHSFEFLTRAEDHPRGGTVRNEDEYSPHTAAQFTVTVRRDGANAPSSVRVTTIDETAKGGHDAVPGADYYTVDKRLDFKHPITGEQLLESSFDVTVIDEPYDRELDEPDETLRVHLSDPEGCNGATDFDLGQDLRLTIIDSDAPPTPAPTDAPAQPARQATPEPSATPSSTPTATPSATPDSFALARDDDSGIPAGAWLAALGALLAIAAGVFLTVRAGRQRIS